MHPNLSVADGDLYSARLLADRLHEDEQFYMDCSNETLELYKLLYSEEVFIKKMYKIFNKIIK